MSTREANYHRRGGRVRLLLDSDVIIDHLHDLTSTVAFVEGLVLRGDELCLCVVVLTEVYSGLLPRDAARAQRLLSACSFLPASEVSARQAGEWRYQYARQGKALATTDALIAGTAWAYDAAVVTGNVSDFPMPEIEVVPLPRVQR